MNRRTILAAPLLPFLGACQPGQGPTLAQAVADAQAIVGGLQIAVPVLAAGGELSPQAEALATDALDGASKLLGAITPDLANATAATFLGGACKLAGNALVILANLPNIPPATRQKLLAAAVLLPIVQAVAASILNQPPPVSAAAVPSMSASQARVILGAR